VRGWGWGWVGVGVGGGVSASGAAGSGDESSGAIRGTRIELQVGGRRGGGAVEGVEGADRGGGC
jgi:hypothetical protein